MSNLMKQIKSISEQLLKTNEKYNKTYKPLEIINLTKRQTNSFLR